MRTSTFRRRSTAIRSWWNLWTHKSESKRSIGSTEIDWFRLWRPCTNAIWVQHTVRLGWIVWAGFTTAQQKSFELRFYLFLVHFLPLCHAVRAQIQRLLLWTWHLRAVQMLWTGSWLGTPFYPVAIVILCIETIRTRRG